jgi:hypothetical protein
LFVPFDGDYLYIVCIYGMFGACLFRGNRPSVPGDSVHLFRG